MAKSLWEQFASELIEAKCDWCTCHSNEVGPLYIFDGNNVCQECLENEEYEEPEIGLTAAERNK